MHDRHAWLQVYCLDLRSKAIDYRRRIHASGKVTSLEFHPLDSNLMMTAGNDHFCRLYDIRMLRPCIATSTCAAPCRAVAAASACGRCRRRCAPPWLRLWCNAYL